MVATDSYRYRTGNGSIIRGTTASDIDCSSIDATSRGYITVRRQSQSEQEIAELRLEKNDLNSELNRIRDLNDKLTTRNTELYRNIDNLKTQMSILYDAVSIFVDISKIESVIKKITAARKNKDNFNTLMGQESKYLNSK